MVLNILLAFIGMFVVLWWEQGLFNDAYHILFIWLGFNVWFWIYTLLSLTRLLSCDGRQNYYWGNHGGFVLSLTSLSISTNDCKIEIFLSHTATLKHVLYVLSPYTEDGVDPYTWQINVRENRRDNQEWII